MRIHYFKQFYTGPSAPGSLQPRKLVAALARRGHEVHVISGAVNAYNEQIEPEEDLSEPSGGRIVVHRVPGSRDIRRNLAARLRSYLGFVRPAMRIAHHLPAPDLVFASIQPLFTAWAARRHARRHRVPWLLEVRDLWPDALEAKGAVSPWLAAPLHALANSLYHSADRVVSVTPGIKIELLKKGLSGDAVDVFPNGFDPDLFQIREGDRERVRTYRGWESSFVALFTGAHTEVTAVDTLVRAAAYLRDRPDIRLDLVGYGQTKPRAMQLAHELELQNVHFHDPVPKRAVPGLVAAADVCLMSLFESPLIHIYFENKLMDYMGGGRPIVAAMGGQQAELIRRFDAGRVVPAFDSEALARCIRDLADDPGLCATLARNGQLAVRDHLLLPEILERYVNVIEAVQCGKAASIPAWEPFL